MQIDFKSQQNYIEPIDGLRAIAVMVVLLFHTGFHWFPGGFIGVELFFVISGFLITRNLIYQISQGNFSLKEFYLNRIARLFPALFTMIILTLVIGFLLLGSEDFVALSESALSATLSISNF